MNKLKLLNRLERKRTFRQLTQGKKKKALGIFLYLLSLWGYFWLGGILPLFASAAVLPENSAQSDILSAADLLSKAGILSSMDIMAVAFFLASLILAFVRIKHIYFDDSDQSTLWSMPVDTRLLLLSKTTGPAIFSLPLTLAFSLPSAFLTYVVTDSARNACLILIAFFCANQLGESLGCFLRIATAKGGSRLQLSKRVKTFIGLTFFVLFMMGFYAELARHYKDLIRFIAFYNTLPSVTRPLSYALNGSIWLIFLLLAATVLIYYAFLSYASKHFFAIAESLTPKSTAKAVKSDDYKVQKKFAALLRKERRLFLSNNAIALNGLFVSLLPMILSGILFIPSVKDPFLAFLHSQSFVSTDSALFLLLVGLAGIMNFAGFGFSLEGLSAYNTYSLPLKGQSIFLGKLLMTLCFIVPSFFVSWLLVIINLHPAPIYWPFYLFGPLAYALLINGISLFFDWKFANYTWTNPQELAKNTKQSFFSGLGSLLITFAILLVGVGIMTKAPLLYASLLSLIFIAGDVVLYFLTKDMTVYHQ
ncbi:MAG: hypothetical protein SOW18_04060 [Peptoniphilus sp.]|nr:hypothetical protein [Peptoniphilus sp.]MDY3118694.1 hypothetical protein [Peptoniphilus sp.]